MRRYLLWLAVLPTLPAAGQQSGGYTIRTVAGQGLILGDGGPAMAAQFYGPCGLAMDGQRNLYVADQGNFRVRMISPSGTITTVAGAGGYGFDGDGGPAYNAKFREVGGLAMDSAGNLYIADYSNHRIRKMTPGGIISTYAGTSQGFGGDGKPAKEALLSFPVDITMDANDNLYIADRGNNRVRKVTRDGIITTIAGNGQSGYFGDGGLATSAKLDTPTAVAVDSAGNVFVTDYNNVRVRKIATSGIIATVAGTGDRSKGPIGPTATTTNLNDPHGLAVDKSGNLYVTTQFAIGKVTPAGGVSVVAGGSQDLSTAYLEGVPATSVLVAIPSNLMFDNAGNLYLSELFGQRVRRITSDGIIRTVAGAGHFSGDYGPAIAAGLFQPTATATDGSGNLYIADAGNQRIRKVSPSGTISTVASQPDVILPCGVALDPAGNVIVPDCALQAVLKVEPSGRVSTIAGNGGDRSDTTGPANNVSLDLTGPTVGVAADGAGNIYLAENGSGYNPFNGYGFQRIRKITPGGTISTLTGAGENTPAGVAVDQAGNIFFANSGDGRIRRIDARTGAAGTYISSLNSPMGVAVDAAGNLFVTEGYAPRILKFAPDKTMTVIAGDGTVGYAGDAGPATEARFGYLGLLALDAAGDLFVADIGNHRIRELSPAGTPSVAAGGVRNAASYDAAEVAADSWVSLFGANLADALAVPPADATQLPTTLGGVTVRVTDSGGTSRMAVLQFVTPTQVNFLMPAGTAPGTATVAVTAGTRGTASGTVRVSSVAPGLFAANASGTGPAAAVAVRVAGDGKQSAALTFQCGAAAGSCVNAPIDMGGASDQVILELFGTGFRGLASPATATVGGQTAQVLGAAAQGQYAGLDQVNILLPRGLAGEAAVVLTVDGKKANTVTVAIR